MNRHRKLCECLQASGNMNALYPVRFEYGETGQAASAPNKPPLKPVRTTKQQVLEEFKTVWQSILSEQPNYKGDSIAKREAFNNFVDGLNKDGIVSNHQAYNWSNPF